MYIIHRHKLFSTANDLVEYIFVCARLGYLFPCKVNPSQKRPDKDDPTFSSWDGSRHLYSIPSNCF